MTYKSLFKLAIQLLGVYVIFSAILQIPKSVGFALLLPRQNGHFFEAIVFQLISILIIALLGYLVVRVAPKISDFFIKNDEPAQLDIKKESIIEIVIIVAGIFMIITRIPDIYPALVSLSKSGGIDVFINTFVTLVACSIIVLKSKAISKFIVGFK